MIFCLHEKMHKINETKSLLIDRYTENKFIFFQIAGSENTPLILSLPYLLELFLSQKTPKLFRREDM